MLRAVRFIVIAAIFLLLAWWIGGIPGTLTAQSGTYTVETSVPAALLILFLIAVLFTVLLRVIGGLRRAPGGFGAWRGNRRQRLGEIATQRGIVALAAGDAAGADAEAGRARKLLGEAPLVLLLTAEAARLAGKHDVATAAFEKLTAHEDMAFLGHRGLLRHHLAQGNHDTAAAHAQAAEQKYPGSAWLRRKRLEIAVKKQDWPAALRLTAQPAEVAALATAAAGIAEARKAVGFAKQAVRADPTLAPAVVAYADALRKIRRFGAARRALIAGWRQAPHPLIAENFIAAFPTPIERAQTVTELVAANPGHPESELLLAQTSLAAQLTGEARRHAAAAIAAGLTDGRAAAVLAALGDKPDAPATPAPVWLCTECHTSHAEWAPACPNCRKPGTLVWKTTGTALTPAPGDSLTVRASGPALA
jgi:HemY protein